MDSLDRRAKVKSTLWVAIRSNPNNELWIDYMTFSVVEGGVLPLYEKDCTINKESYPLIRVAKVRVETVS